MNEVLNSWAKSTMDLNNMANEFQNLLLKSETTDLNSLELSKYIFFDIETTPYDENIEDTTTEIYDSWKAIADKKFNDDLLKGYTYNEIYQENSALMAEFNKVICISIGRFINGSIETASLFCKQDISENIIIQHFMNLLSHQPTYILSGFNIIGFDVPVLAKKMIKYNIKFPNQFKLFNIKPWDRQILDLYEFWKMGSYNSGSLRTISTFLECGDPKKNVHGADVKKLYENKKYKEIIQYCEGDVYSTMCIFSKIYNMNLL